MNATAEFRHRAAQVLATTIAAWGLAAGSQPRLRTPMPGHDLRNASIPRCVPGFAQRPQLGLS